MYDRIVWIVSIILMVLLVFMCHTNQVKAQSYNQYKAKDNQIVTKKRSVFKKGSLKTKVYEVTYTDNRYKARSARERYQINQRIKSGDLPLPKVDIKRIE